MNSALKNTEIESISCFSKIEVRNREEFEIAVEALKTLKTFKSRIVNYFKPIKGQAYKAYKMISQQEKEELNPVSELDTKIRGRVQEYTNREEQKRIALQREAERIARQKAEAERAKLLARAAAAKTESKKAELTEKAEDVYAEPVFVQPSIEKTTRLNDGGTVSFKEDVNIVVVDKDALLKEIVRGNVPSLAAKIHDDNLKKWVKASGKMGNEVPGIVIQRTKQMAVR